MISRNLTLTITDKNTSLDKSIILYRYDRGITLNFKLQSDTYDIEKQITKARAIILKPNKKVSSTPITNIGEGIYTLYLDDTWTDHLGEVGTYQIQLQLYSNKPNDECITIQPFTFEVKNPIGIPDDSVAYVDQATANNYSAGYSTTDVPTGDLDNGEYLKTSWIGGDLITAGKLNKIETVLSYLVNEVCVLKNSGEEPEPESGLYFVSFTTYGSKQLTVNNVDVTDQVVEGITIGDTILCRYETNEPITQVSFKDNTDVVKLFGLSANCITDMTEIFSGCTSFVGTVSYIDTWAVTSMNSAFKNCTSLTNDPTLYFLSVDSITDMTEMFSGCVNLSSLVSIDRYWNNPNIINYYNCFYNCTALDNYNEVPAEWGGPSNDSGGGMPTPGGPETPPEGPVIPPEPSEPEEPSEPTETYAISFSTLGSKKLTVNNVDVTDQVVETGGYGDTISCKYETTEVIRQASFKDNTDLVRVFGLDTSMMFHTEEMFSGCTNLVAILPMLDSGMAYSTRAMFKNCTSLTSMETIGSFTAASNKSEMFYNCSSLTGTVPSWDYWLNGAVTEYADCFHNCTSLDNYSEIPASWGGPSNE